MTNATLWDSRLTSSTALNILSNSSFESNLSSPSNLPKPIGRSKNRRPTTERRERKQIKIMIEIGSYANSCVLRMKCLRFENIYIFEKRKLFFVFAEIVKNQNF